MAKRYRILERNDGICFVEIKKFGLWFRELFPLSDFPMSIEDKDAAKAWIDKDIKYYHNSKIKNIEEYP